MGKQSSFESFKQLVGDALPTFPCPAAAPRCFLSWFGIGADYGADNAIGPWIDISIEIKHTGTLRRECPTQTASSRYTIEIVLVSAVVHDPWIDLVAAQKEGSVREMPNKIQSTRTFLNREAARQAESRN
jgi:hypothetical protein